MRAGGWVAAKATLAILAAALAMLTAWTAVRRFRVQAASCARPSSGRSRAPHPWLPTPTQVYPEIPAALAVMIAVSALTGPLDRRRLAVVTLAVVALPWLSIKYAPVAACLAAITAVAAATIVAPASIGVVAALVYRGGRLPRRPPRLSTAAGPRTPAATTSRRPASSRSSAARRTTSADRAGSSACSSTTVSASPRGWWVGSRCHSQLGMIASPTTGQLAAARASARHRMAHRDVRRPRRCTAGGGRVANSWSCCRWRSSPSPSQPTLRRALRRFLVVSAVLGAVTWLWTTIEAITRQRVLVVDFDQTDESVDATVAARAARRTIADPGRWNPRCCCGSCIVIALVVTGWTRTPVSERRFAERPCAVSKVHLTL